MNLTSSHHRVDRFWPPLIVDVTVTATVPIDDLLAMPQEQAIRAIFTGHYGPSVPITETLHNEFQTVTPIHPANIDLIIERIYRRKKKVP